MQIPTIARLGQISILAGIAVLTGCASGPTIVANRALDFHVADYQSFSFVQPLGSDRGGVRTLISQHLIDATTREMEMQGLRHADTNGA